jgi:site-specific recombinase XerD
MPTKKVKLNGTEIAIYNDAIIYKRGEYWQFRLWLTKERKYARFSLKTRNETTAKDRAELHYHELRALELSGKTYYSKTTKEGVRLYLEQREKDLEAGLIVKGRLSTIKTHLEHFLDFIGRDTKLKELDTIDCENYFHTRSKSKKKETISQTTVENEQSTINAMMGWLHKRKETYIDKFEFKKFKRIDRGLEDLRRSSFTDEEIANINKVLDSYIAEGKKAINEKENLIKVLAGYYLVISLMTGMRRGEQKQLRWQDYEEFEHKVDGKGYNLVKITVRGDTSKVGKTRKFVEKDIGYFEDLFKLQYPRFTQLQKSIVKEKQIKFADALIFSIDGYKPITDRAIAYHFDKILELSEVKNLDKRNIVPYSFRHYYITQKVNSGLAPTAVAEIAGTSTTQIEKTYYHTTDAKMIANAFAGYVIKDGLLIPK